MPTLLTPLLLAITGSLICLPCFGITAPLRVGIHHAGEPLIYYDNNKVQGIIPELLVKIGKAANISLRFDTMPYQRIFTGGTQARLDLGLIYYVNGLPLSKNSVKLECFDQPLINSQLNIYGIALSKSSLPRLGTYTSIASEQHQYPTIAGKQLRAIGLSKTQALFKSLFTGRIDYIVASQLQSEYWQQKMDIPGLQSFAAIGQATGYLCYPASELPSIALQNFRNFMKTVRPQDFQQDIDDLLQKRQLPLEYRSSLLPSREAVIQDLKNKYN